MVAEYKRRIRDGTEYNHLFPRPDMKIVVLSEDTDVWETVDWIQKIIHDTLHQTKDIAQKLRRQTIYETLRAIWHFVYDNIQYKEDDEEELHKPARIWHKRKIGVDCDDYAIMISSILCNLGIKHVLRLAEYKHKGYYQHIYVAVWLDRRWVILDPVKDQFDVEHPYTNIKDIPMRLKMLSGIPGDTAKDAPDFNIYGQNGEVVKYNFVRTAANATDNAPAQKPDDKKPDDKKAGEDEKAPFLSGKWFKKNQTPLLVGSIAIGLGWLVYLSFAHEAEEKEKEAKKKPAKDKDELSGVPNSKKLKNTLV